MLPISTLIMTVTLALFASAGPITPKGRSKPASSSKVIPVATSRLEDSAVNGVFNLENAKREIAYLANKYRRETGHRIMPGHTNTRKHPQTQDSVKPQGTLSGVVSIPFENLIAPSCWNMFCWPLQIPTTPNHTLPLAASSKTATKVSALKSQSPKHGKRNGNTDLVGIRIGTPPQQFRVNFDSKLLANSACGSGSSTLCSPTFPPAAGSSDIWVPSSDLSTESMWDTKRKFHIPASTTAAPVPNSVFEITYVDGLNTRGPVYTDESQTFLLLRIVLIYILTEII